MPAPPNPIVAAAIAATASTPAGFSAQDLPPELAHTGHGIADRLAKKGRLIKAHGGARKVRFFTDAAMASAYLAVCAQQHRLDKAQATAKASAAPKLRRAELAKAGIKPRQYKKPAAPAAPVVQAQPAAQPSPAQPRSMMTKLTPVKQVEPIYPPGYKFTTRPMAQPRNQVVDLPGIYGGMGAMRHQINSSQGPRIRESA